MREQAVQVVVDNGLGLLGRGLATEDALAQACARSALLTPAEARARGSLMPHAEVAVVPGSHGGFNRIDELNNRITVFIKAHATGKHAVQPA